MKHFTLLFSILFLSNQLFSQVLYDENRYRHAIFSQVTVQNNVQYSSAPQWVWPYWDEDLNLNVYQPTADIVPKRPLIIFAHAGGFLNGSKDVDDMVAICDSFARKGYVTATIDYRKGFNPLDEESAERAVYRGIQDGKAAVRYFKQNASTYKIDTNFVYFGGMSAGGFMALHIAYMDLESERPQSTFGGGTVNNLGCLNCAGGNTNRTSNVRAALNYWGAIQDTTLIAAGNIPLLLMHGTDDPTVPYEYGQPFGLFTLPHVYGSKPVQKRLDNLGIYNEIYTSNVPDLHMLDGSNNGTFENPPTPFWYDTLLPRTTDFLVKMTKSNPTKISADTVAICYNDSHTFQINGNNQFFHRWTLYEGTTRTVLPETTTNATLTLNNPGMYKLAVVEFNEVYCASDTLWFHIMQQPEIIPTAVSPTAIIACMGAQSTLEVSDIPNATYTWFQQNDGTTTLLNSDSTQITLTYSTPDVYEIGVYATNEFGCMSDTVLFEINQLATPVPTIIGEHALTLCTDEIGVFHVSGQAGSTFAWSSTFNNTTVTIGATADTLSMIFNNPGTYTVSVIETTQNGCVSAPVTYTVEQLEPVNATFTYLLSNYTYAVFTANAPGATTFEWSFGDGATATVQNPVHQYASDGTYTVDLTVTFGNGCQLLTSQTITINHLSVNELIESAVLVYPNPMLDALHISNTTTGKLNIRIIDMQGKCVQQSMKVEGLQHISIDTQNWESGMYFLEITDENDAINIRKIVK